MFQVRQVTDQLPPGFECLEDEDFVTVICHGCEAELVYHCNRATADDLIAGAIAHQATCPQPLVPR